jgi:Phage tail assembly chaperone proteins, E, or 41 or 14
MPETVTVTLSRPITAIDQTFSELKLRMPTGADLAAADFPLRYRPGNEVLVDAASMSRLINRCAGIPPVAVDEMPAGDWMACADVISDFVSAGVAPITLREPKGIDIARAGHPLRFHPGSEIAINGKSMGAIISALADLPPAAVQEMPSDVWAAYMEQALRFFTPTAQKSLIDTSTAPGSGEPSIPS